MSTKTALGLILRARLRTPSVPELEKPPVNADLLIVPGINPSKQRKGKSGELARARGRKQ